MNTPQSQIKVNIPAKMKSYLEIKADKYGMPIGGYIKHLILKDIENMDFPTYQASKSTENAYIEALIDHKSGKTEKVKDINSFFESL